jgi:hypothetical protein
MPPPPKPTLSLLQEILFLAGAAIFDLFKILLAFTDAALVVPIVGEGVFAIAQVATYMLSILEFLLIFGGLWLSGAYKKKRGMSGILFTASTAIIDLIPLVDDLPATTGAVLTVVTKSRAQDKAELKEYHKKQEAAAKQQHEQALKQQASEQAAARAGQTREQALAQSKAAIVASRANDNSAEEVRAAA